MLIVGVVTAGAQAPWRTFRRSPSRSSCRTSPPGLRARPRSAAISAWTNGLFGGGSPLSSLCGNQTPAGLFFAAHRREPRAGSGLGTARRASSRRARAATSSPSQRRHYLDLGLDDRAHRHALRGSPGRPGAARRSRRHRGEPRPGDGHRALIQEGILSPNATLGAPGHSVVAGRQTSTLTLTPTSPVTTFGSGWSGGDRRTALGAAAGAGLREGRRHAVMSAGFKTVSFAPISNSLSPSPRRAAPPWSTGT